MGPLYILFGRVGRLLDPAAEGQFLALGPPAVPHVQLRLGVTVTTGSTSGMNITWALIFGVTLGGAPFAFPEALSLFRFLRSDHRCFPDPPRQLTERSDVTGANWPLAALEHHPMYRSMTVLNIPGVERERHLSAGFNNILRNPGKTGLNLILSSGISRN